MFRIKNPERPIRRTASPAFARFGYLALIRKDSTASFLKQRKSIFSVELPLSFTLCKNRSRLPLRIFLSGLRSLRGEKEGIAMYATH